MTAFLTSITRWGCVAALICLTGVAHARDSDVILTEVGLRVGVSSAGHGHAQAVRIAVAPAGAAIPNAASSNVSIGLQDCHVSFDAATQTLTVSHRDGGRWIAQFRKLDRFGRAHVAGLEIAWQAYPAEAIYGLGERFDALNVAGRRTEMWIVDQPGQGDGSATYFATPILFSSAGYGFFADDNPEAIFDLNSTGDGWNRYQRAGESASFVVTFGPDVPSMIRDRAAMIGGLEPAPAWAYAPWISRNSYENQAEAEAAMDGMRSRDLPFGVIVLEAWKGHSESGEFNRFSSERWPELERFMERCRREKVKVVLWQVPILHPSSPWFEEAEAEGYLVRDPTGDVSLREEWLAGFGNIDFLNPDAAAFWKDMLRPVVRMGVAGFKADDGEAIKPTDRLGNGVPGWQAHNDYSTLYKRATYEVFQEEGVDGMLWARSGSVGIESTPALWAGDQGASWDQLRRLVTAGMSTSISGMPYWSHDIGGFYGECSPELYMRWLQLGAFSPLMQFHGNTPREPWHFGEPAVEAYRLLANLRMNLLPTLVELGAEAAENGMPVMRPMFFVTGKHDGPETVDQYMLGKDLLVASVMEEGASGRVVRFPTGRWLHALSPMAFQGPGEFSVPIGLIDAPLFIREGSTLKVRLAEGQRLGQWSGDETEVTIVVSPETLWGHTPVLSNVQAPLRGHPLGGNVAVDFTVSDQNLDGLHARWWFADSPNQVFEAPVVISPEGVGRADLTPPDVGSASGRRQVYEFFHATSSQETSLLRGEVDWNNLVSVNIDDPYLNVVSAGPARVAGRVTYRTSVACKVELHLVLPEDVTAASRTRTVDLDPGRTADFEWQLDVAPTDGLVGDSRVVVEARVNDVVLDRAEAALIHSPRWLLAGPFPAESKTDGFAATTAAEWTFSPEARFRTSAGLLRWEALDPEAVVEMDGMDFNKIYGETTNAFVYAMAVVHSDRDQPVQLRVGSDDTLSLWVNGDMLIAEDYARAAVPDQDVIDAVFRKGENRLLIKVAQGEGGWGLVTRITVADGGPVEGLTDALGDVSAYRPDRPEAGVEVDSGPYLHWRYLGPVPYGRNGNVPGVIALEKAIADGQALPESVGPLAWRKLESGASLGWTDLKSISRDDYVLVYCTTEIELEAPAEIELRCGSDDGLLLWVEDELVIDSEVPRAFKPGEDVARVKLTKGLHRIVARISQGQGQWGFDVRLWDMSRTPPEPLRSKR